MPSVLETVASYLPRYLIAHASSLGESGGKAFDAAVLLADVSGFTALAERLARLGRQGSEDLTRQLNE